MASIQKLEIKPNLNGYEFTVKDVTGFGPAGYSEDGLNVNNVLAVVLVLKNSFGELVNSLRLEGGDKNEFMSGLKEVVMAYPEEVQGMATLRKQFSPDIYSIEAYLITKVVNVRGLANQSEVTGTDLDVVLGDPFIIDETNVYEVDNTFTNGGTVLQLRSLIKRFFNKGSFGFKSVHKALNYVRILKTLYKTSCMRMNVLQKDGEANNYAVLIGHLNVIKYKEDLGDFEGVHFIMQDARVLAEWLDNRYFKF